MRIYAWITYMIETNCKIGYKCIFVIFYENGAMISSHARKYESFMLYILNLEKRDISSD